MNPVYKIVAVRTVQMSALGVFAHFVLHWPFTGPFALGFFLTSALCVYFVFVFAGWTWGLPILTRLPGADSAVALTFDDGPSAETTPLILDVLRSESARATFFVLGEAVDRCPELLRRIVAEGHSIGIHAYTHESLVLKNARAVLEELQRAEAAVHCACPEAKVIPWVRPPHGFKSLTLLWTLRRAGYGLAAWSVNSRDYLARDPAQIAARVLEAKAGAIVLLHDGPNNSVTASALPALLRGLAEQGLAAGPLPDWVSF